MAAGKRKDLERAGDLKESIAHLDQVSARIARMLADLATPKGDTDGRTHHETATPSE